LITEGRHVELDVIAGSEVPIIKDGVGIAAASRKGNGEPLLTEGRDKKSSKRKTIIVQDEDEAQALSIDQSGSDDGDGWLYIDEGSGADGKVEDMAKEAYEVDICALSDDAVLTEEVVAKVIQQTVPIALTYDENNPFIKAYNGSIKKARDLITGQWSDCIWDKTTLDIQAPTTRDEVCVRYVTLALVVHDI
jgi:hypothetical protein